jgi:hypothetical protein
MTQQTASASSGTDGLTFANNAVVGMIQQCEGQFDDWGEFFGALQMLTIQAVRDMPPHSINIHRNDDSYSVAIDGPIYSVTYNGTKTFT